MFLHLHDWEIIEHDHHMLSIIPMQEMCAKTQVSDIYQKPNLSFLPLSSALPKSDTAFPVPSTAEKSNIYLTHP